jgi:FkbM family methyltransferase
VAVDRRALSPAERAARRERVRRRAAARHGEGEILTLAMHGRSYRLWVWPGKIAACMRVGKPYEAPLLEHIRQQHFTGTAVDAGANLGNHTMWFAVMCGLRVVAFEPVWPDKLAYNVMLNSLAGRVRVEPVALGDVAAVAEHMGKGRLRTGSGALPVRTLDEYDLVGVSVIKADVEGMEAVLLRGAERTIRRSRPVIFAEEWGAPEHAQIATVLEPWGYRMTKRFQSKGVATAIGRWDGR